VNDKVAEQASFCCQFELPMQPFLLVIGTVREIKEVYVRVASYNYKVAGVIEGIDALFKLFFILNVKYPFESSPVWLLFQQYFFNIQLKTDPKIAKVSSVLSLLNN
jgi:hypothetical protein